MGLVNQATNILDRVINLERGLDALRKMAGLTSAIISRGGLTLLNDSFIKMVSTAGYRIFFVGKDDVSGLQTFELRRDNGSLVMQLYATGGQQFWGLYARSGSGIALVADDAVSGVGLARPWLSHPLYPLFSMAQNSVYSYLNLPVASVTAETTLWSGRIPSVTHPRVEVDGLWGQASGVNNSTYRLKINGTTVGTWNETGLTGARRGPFNVVPYIDNDFVGVDLTCVASGTGNVACQVYGLAQRQT